MFNKMDTTTVSTNSTARANNVWIENATHDDALMSETDGDGIDDEEEPLYDNAETLVDTADTTSSSKELTEIRETTQFIGVARTLILLTILTFAFVAGSVVYLITVNHEVENYNQEYSESSLMVFESVQQKFSTILWTAQTFANEISQDWKEYDWPNVTVTNFASRCRGPMMMTKATMISFAPKIDSNTFAAWNKYASESFVQDNNEYDSGGQPSDFTFFSSGRSVQDGVYKFENGSVRSVTSVSKADYAYPIWQLSHIPQITGNSSMSSEGNQSAVGIMFDESSNVVRSAALQQLRNRRGSVSSGFLFEDSNGSDVAFFKTPATILYYPIFSTAINASINGVLNIQLSWEILLSDLFNGKHTKKLVAVVENQCGGKFSYSIEGNNASFMGAGDLHDRQWVTDVKKIYNTSYSDFLNVFDTHGSQSWDPTTACAYRLTVHPSSEFQATYMTYRPNAYQGIVLLTMCSILAVVMVFDNAVQKKQKDVAEAAKRSDAIVRSLFPGTMTDRLYEKTRALKGKNKGKKWAANDDSTMLVATQKSRLLSLLRSPTDNQANFSDEPLADLYPSASVIFADMAGFTSWSTERHPSAVFTLLERIYKSMDQATKVYGVFKVETIGDCYVAATGLPESRSDHAIAMCRFSRVCMRRTNYLFKTLVSELGPGTDELQLRIGINSGPVTAGVLRSQKSRFQLFGDTINMASRIESTGLKGRIHLSASTAALLIAAGKSDWVVPREESIEAKGVGIISTYWLIPGRVGSCRSGSIKSEQSVEINNEDTEHDYAPRNDKTLQHLINWNVDVLLQRLQNVVKRRTARGKRKASTITQELERKILCGNGEIPIKEFKMEITIPDFDAKVEETMNDTANINVDPKVTTQLQQFVTAVASGYLENSFHDFQHASHVVLASTKILNRIMAADEHGGSSEGTLTSQDLYEHTFGISTDPLAHFAVLFCCMCHDLNHPGVPNAQLLTESPHLASKYECCSVAEQNSIDIAFELLMLPHFVDLRRTIYETEEECRRFRQLCVNLILATDVMDKNLNAKRNERWNLCFNNDVEEGLQYKIGEDRHRRATIVLEHIMQASDVAHTFQHWAIYTKWNECLFQEMYKAYLDGRAEKDPSENWYQGEMNFFDFYIIPLAEKLKQCWRVFGISQSEFLTYAKSNRMEWEVKGKDLVEAMKSRVVLKMKPTETEYEGLSL